MRNRPLAASITAVASLTAAISIAASPATADFTGFGSTSYVVQGTENTYHVMEVYATFDDPTDRVLNAFNVTASLANAIDPQATAVFFQAESVIDEIPKSFLPMGYLPPGEAWRFDTYVTIGALQGNMLNGTIADPGFNDAKFVDANEIGGAAGWYNIPPTNSFGLAGSDLKVLLGVFVVTADQYAPGLNLQFEGTVGYANSGAVAFGTGSRQFFYPSGGLTKYAADELDYDGRSDLLFYNPISRQLAGWLMLGVGRKTGGVFSDAVPAGYTLQGMGDLDGNGSTDIVWRDAQGRFHAWLTDGLTVLAKGAISLPIPSNWQCVGIGDISGDGRGDIVLQDSVSGNVNAWLMEGFVKIAGGLIGNASGKTAEAIADLDGDGHQDILWRASNGVVSAWLMQGLDIGTQGNITNVSGPVAAEWLVAGVADVSGDGKADVIWRHRTMGTVCAWMMNGTQRVTGGLMNNGAAIGSVWRIDGLRDLNGDGKYDIVWRNTLTGDVNAWILDGFAKTQGGFIRNANTQWGVVAP